MALSGTERQRLRRARLKEAKRSAPDSSASIVRGSFAEFVKKDDEAQFVVSFMQETLASVGINQCPDFAKDHDPHGEPWGLQDNGAIGLATRTVDAFIDCAKHLAEIINRFKLAELEAAISRLERTNLTTQKARKEALAEIVKLHAIKSQLEREVRHRFHATEAKGE